MSKFCSKDIRRTVCRGSDACSYGSWSWRSPRRRARGRRQRLKVGITLHPYYSFVANIVGDRAEIVPLIDADAIRTVTRRSRTT